MGSPVLFLLEGTVGLGDPAEIWQGPEIKG